MKADRLTIAKVFGMFSLSVGLIAASAILGGIAFSYFYDF
jgi:hypothetical protein